LIGLCQTNRSYWNNTVRANPEKMKRPERAARNCIDRPEVGVFSLTGKGVRAKRVLFPKKNTPTFGQPLKIIGGAP
jgi:hypothetical protein